MKVTDKVIKLEATKGCYAYIIIDDEMVMIDTGMPKMAKQILDEMKQYGIQKNDLKHILLTHNDVDHVGSAAELVRATSATLWCSNVDIPFVMGQQQRYGMKRFVSKFMKYEKPEKIYPFDSNKLPGKLQVIETPGHTPGHVCFLYDRVLFTGDLIVHMMGKLSKSKRIMTWNMDEVDHSIKKVLSYDFDTICMAHGEPIKVNDEVRSQLEALVSLK